MKTEDAQVWTGEAWSDEDAPTRNPAALLRKAWPWPLNPETDKELGEWYEHLADDVVDDVAADLEGTCDAASGEIMEELEADLTLQEKVDQLVFCCVACGWWVCMGRGRRA